jgi:sortase A
VLIRLFVAYQLWGTGIREAQAQDRLETKFRQRLAQVDGATIASTTASTANTGSTTTETLPVTTAGPLAAAPIEGEPIGQIEIPKIGLSAYVIEGVSDSDLHNGPGHYPGSPLPGQKGNAAIAGHRTTYGAPFASIDELAPGDTIKVTTLQGSFSYAVVQQADGSGHIIVNPNQTEVLDDVGDNRLTLTACHPKYSASERIIVFATLQGEPKPAPPRRVDAPKPELNGLSGKRAPKLPVVMFALLCAAIWVAAWQVGNRWRKWPAYAIGLPFFLVALFFFFENFSRLLPSNY